MKNRFVALGLLAALAQAAAGCDTVEDAVEGVNGGEDAGSDDDAADDDAADDDAADDDAADDDAADDDAADDDAADDDAADDDAADDDAADDDAADDDAGDDDAADADGGADDDTVGDDDVAVDAGPDDDDVVGDDDVSVDAGSDDDVSPEPSGCQAPVGATVLADFQSYTPDGGPAYAIASDGTTVYVAFLDRIVSLPQAGGAPTEVYVAQGGLGLAMYDVGGSSHLVRDGLDWFDLDGTGAIPANLPMDAFSAAVTWVAPKDGDTVWVRRDNLLDRVATYTLLVRGEGAERPVATDVADGTGGPLVAAQQHDFALVQRAPLDRGLVTGAEEFVLVSEDGQTSSGAIADVGRPFLMTGSHVYYTRSDEAPLDAQGVWRAAVAASGVSGAARLGGAAFQGFTGVEDSGRVALHGTSKLYTILDEATDTTLVELIDLPVSSVIDESCTSHGVALANGEVISTMFSEASDETLIFKVAVP